jgi:hypothetical protein
MEQIGQQVRLPFRRAFQIALSGIRIRFGRSLVTVSGVVLGIAFLMSNLTGQLVKKSIAQERDQRNTVNLMLSLIKAEVGELAGRPIAVSTFGQLSAVEQALLAQLRATADLREAPGAGVRLILGDQPKCPATLASLTADLSQRVVIDSLAAREFPDGTPASVRRELFFGKETEEQLAKEAQLAHAEKFRNWWIVSISLLVTVFGVANALLMSVTERFREIGTMKCLGALSSFIRRLFLIESSLIGLAGSILGVIVGAILPLVAYGLVYRFGLVFGTLPVGWLAAYAVLAVVVGTLLSVVAAIYPARFASRMVPASALRSTV